MQVLYLSALSVLVLCLSAIVDSRFSYRLAKLVTGPKRFIRALETRQPWVDLHSKRFETASQHSVLTAGENKVHHLLSRIRLC